MQDLESLWKILFNYTRYCTLFQNCPILVNTNIFCKIPVILIDALIFIVIRYFPKKLVWRPKAIKCSARRAIIIVVLMIPRDVARVAQARILQARPLGPACARQRGSSKRALPFYRALAYNEISLIARE
jgi:hypothetical protein